MIYGERGKILDHDDNKRPDKIIRSGREEKIEENIK